MRTLLGSLLLGSAGILSLLGCGGGGGSSAASATLGLYLTDSFRSDYDHVWMTLHKVELRSTANGAFVTSFDSPTGEIFDAKRLRDVSGERFSFLGVGEVPPGTYDAIRVTLANEVVLVPTGSTNGQTYNFAASLPRDGNGRPMITFNLTAPITLPGAVSHCVIDFDLQNFAIVNGEVVPSLKHGSENGIDDSSRHEIEDYDGVVRNLTASSFTLDREEGGAFQVLYDANTVIYDESTGASGTLANNQRVEVRGKFDVNQNALLADSIKIEDGNSDELAEAEGAIDNVNLEANTMLLVDVHEVEHFVPQGSTVNVTWTEATIFRRSGDVVDETWLNLFNFAEVKGTYDSNTNTILATRITLEDENGEEGEDAEAKGSITQVDLNENTMVLTNLTEVEHFTPQGDQVNVVWNESTVFERSGETVTENALLQYPFAEVKGHYDSKNNTITASRIKVDDD